MTTTLLFVETYAILRSAYQIGKYVKQPHSFTTQHQQSEIGHILEH
jgi:hypothetical protein